MAYQILWYRRWLPSGRGCLGWLLRGVRGESRSNFFAASVLASLAFRSKKGYSALKLLNIEGTKGIHQPPYINDAVVVIREGFLSRNHAALHFLLGVKGSEGVVVIVYH